MNDRRYQVVTARNRGVSAASEAKVLVDALFVNKVKRP